MAARFYVEITFYAALTEGQLWPDGDAPESPTIRDVEELIERSGGPEFVANDWNLPADTTIVKVG